jgi:ribosomal protein S8
LESAIEITDKIVDSETSDLFNEILSKISMEICHKIGITEALEIANSISCQYTKSDAFEKIAIELAKRGKIQKSIKLIRQIRDKKLKYIRLAHLATFLAKIGEKAIAKGLTRNIMNNIKKMSDIYLKDEIILHLALTAIELDDINNALKILKSSLNQYISSGLITNVLKSLSMHGFVDESIEVVFKIYSNDKAKYYLTRALFDISVTLFDCGNLQAADKTIKMALDIAEENPDKLSIVIIDISLELYRRGHSNSIGLVDLLSEKQDKSLFYRELSLQAAKCSDIKNALIFLLECEYSIDLKICFEAILENINKDNNNLFLDFIKNKIISKEIKEICYDLLLNALEVKFCLVQEIIPKIILEILYYKNLLCKALIIYVISNNFLENSAQDKNNAIIQKIFEVIEIDYYKSLLNIIFKEKYEML